MKSFSISDWVQPQIAQLSAYRVADASGMIKLDAMENPYDMPKALKAAWQQQLGEVALNRYPDPSASQLTEQIRSAFGISPQAKIMLGNGSDELIQIIAMAVNKPNASIMSLEPGFVMYRMIATCLDLNYVPAALNPNSFDIDLDATLALIEQHQPAALFIAYPNNPTGNLYDRAAVEALIEAAPGLVVIDEAYEPFAADSFMPQVSKYPNLLVMRTLSKFGLAGVRLGYMAGSSDIMSELDKIRLPYNINVLSQITAEFVLKHKAEFDHQAEQIIEQRQWLLNNLPPQVSPFPSQANFILMRTPPGQASRAFEALKQQGILIKNLDQPGTPLANCLRLTVGTEGENQQFIVAFTEILNSLN